MRSCSSLNGPCGSSGKTTISVCINRIGAPNCSDSGAVADATAESFSRSSSTGTDPGIGPTPDDPASVRCGALYRASRGSYFSLISRIFLPASPPISAITKIPLSCNLPRHHGHDRRECPRIRDLYARSQKTLIESVVRMRMLITVDLDSRERSNGCARHYIARPMRIVVNPRHSGQSSPTIYDGPYQPA